MTYTGIDLHKSFSYFTTVDETGGIVKEQKITNEPNKILDYFRNFDGQPKAVVECTLGWYWLVDLLAANGVDITLANTRMMKAIAAAKVKTDRVDAAVMAQLLRMDFIPPAYQIPAGIREKRDLMRFRLTLVHKKVNSVNGVHRLLEKFNLDDPEQLEGGYYYQYLQLQDQIETFEQQIKELEESFYKEFLPTPDVQRLLHIPGIGEIDAYAIVLETGDVRRFPDAKNYLSYARLVPGSSNSGGKTRHNYKYSKAGNKYLKIAFTDAAVHALRYYPVIREFYKRKVRKKGKRLAQNLVAKELAKLVYFVLYHQTEYNNTFKAKPLQHIKRHRWPRPASPRLELAQ